KATHHCYAYRIGFDGNQFRANDDGEPAGTAGKPILGQIDSFRLSNVLVVVVRYFGGTLLGAGGLVHAYRTAAAAALGNGAIVERVIEETFELAFHYALMNDVMYALKKTEARFVAQDFGDSARVTIAFPRARVAENFLRLKALVAKVHLEEAALLGDINGLQIKRVEERRQR
ncbi:MAG: IMPACT family protein, partial [Haliscomenobacter sp.]